MSDRMIGMLESDLRDAVTAAVLPLKEEIATLKSALAAAEASLAEALVGVAHATDEKDGWCWCAYTQMIHPPDDPQDAVPLEANFHTKECNAARAALALPREEGRIVEFNINSDVWVRLTEVGRRARKQHWKELRMPMEQAPLAEQDGWSRWQLWDLMAVFGGCTGNGLAVPFETTIRLAAPPPPRPCVRREGGKSVSRKWTLERPFRWCWWRIAIEPGLSSSTAWGVDGRRTEWRRWIGPIWWRTRLDRASTKETK